MRTTPDRSPARTRRGIAAAAVPTALAVGLALLPNAGAQQDLAALSSGSSNLIPDGATPGTPPQRTPIQVEEYPHIDGLPEGVSVNRIEYLTPHHVKVWVKSAAMPDQEVGFQVLLARDWYSNPNATFAEVWALDGLRARDDESGWTIDTNIENFYRGKNVNVVMPIGGQSSFYTDWEQPDQGKHYKWETFLTQELIPIMDNKFRSNKDRAVVGISMGGTSAVNLAERKPHLFKFVGSFSGYLDTTSIGMPQAIDAAQKDAGGFTATKMWGPYGSQNWIDHDPKLGIEALKDMTVYVSAGSGKDDFGLANSVARGQATPAGVGLEVLSRMSTQTFINRAKAVNVEPVVKFRPSGVHSWEYWDFEMKEAWPYISKSLNLTEDDGRAECSPVGAIAEATKDGKLGECVNNEYDAAHGKAEDFTGGTAYWSPATGAHGLYGAINARYAEAGGPSSWLGFPKTGEQGTPDGVGRFVHFENGSIYWTPATGAWAIPGDMVAAWAENGWETGDLKYPSAPVTEVGAGFQQFFQNGVLTRNPDKSHAIVHGAIGAKYKELGGAESKLGFPRGGERPVNGGYFQEFEHGNIYWSPQTGAHFILHGAIFDAWGKARWEQGEYGWPTEDFADIPTGGLVQKFQHGELSQVFGVVQGKKF
ncbi:hypothetical protein G7Y31_11005 [Corynebacterium lizhenjunii]|uniref:Acyl-CoA:diacylglycerol acyltransferase n=1 Tax=Corynebacterium lizhenjunii TaxID=2709394 RepID=A0A7T0KDY2_9CORY|nr:alpha/beta hydrolase-fold protein [Corynebacterium lizhenjunii]QPK79011.1 hypothetical protein G7Y31_11005 [Corynebacterium lizhenjunii]